MTTWDVNLVTAFGRGSALAQALQNQGFNVRVLDFTAAFANEYRRSTGPFPIPLKDHLPEQKTWLAEAEKLPRGLAFWLADGPVELNGPMTPFYAETRADVKALAARAPEFRDDWMRRFLLQWASPFQRESWAVESGESFPFQADLGLIPSYDEAQVMGFERLSPVSCQSLIDVTVENSRLTQIVIEAGQNIAYSADQWVWCLSSRETEILNESLAPEIFNRGIWRPEWSWISFAGDCETGPWLEGLPDYMIVIGDVFLPWVYANAMIVRRLQPDGFRIWMKVPSKASGENDSRRRWAADAEALLGARLSMAKWTVDATDWGVCPHSPVFEAHHSDWGKPPWKNMDWIAPETLKRLDLGARLEREALSFHRLIQWRNDQLKKQGENRDSAVHAP